MSDYDCKRIVYSSSATVYGTPPIIPIPETTRLQADSPYGKTKVMAETIIDDLCHGMSFLIGKQGRLIEDEQRIKSGRASPCVISSDCFPFLFDLGADSALSSPAGAHPSGQIGEDPRGRPGNLLPLLAHMAVGLVKDATLKVFGNDYPTPCVLVYFCRNVPVLIRFF